MRKLLISSGAVLLAVALLLAGAPAQAGSMSWEDDPGDPSTGAQGTLDITKVAINFDGSTFFATLDMAALGEPAPFGTGQHFAFRFNYGEGQYTLRLTQDRFHGEVFTFQERTGESEVTTIPCKTCKAELDFEASQVRMQIGMSSLTSAMRKLAPGQSIEGLTALTGAAYSDPSGMQAGVVFSGHTILWGNTPGDSAPAPDGAKFTF